MCFALETKLTSVQEGDSQYNFDLDSAHFGPHRAGAMGEQRYITDMSDVFPMARITYRGLDLYILEYQDHWEMCAHGGHVDQI